MNCPNCGHEMLRGHLYCEKCGMEIRIVPDFEPEIENSITEALSTVAGQIENDKTPEEKAEESVSKALPLKETDSQAFFEEDVFGEDPFGENFTEEERKWVLVRLVTFVLMTVSAVIITVFMYISHSVSYQIKKAREYAGQGEYQEAVRLLDKAAGLDPDNAKIVLLEANYYYLLGEKQKAAELLTDLIEKNALEDLPEDLVKAYESIISIYDEQNRYEEINDLLLKCKDEEITARFQHYLALEPEYSYAKGSYDEVIPLKLSANTTGSIYYTLDGSTPTRQSRVYTAPIFLESGTYQVNALFVNDYGIESKVVRNWYEINLAVPDPPQVLLFSGKYTAPVKIEVISQESEIVYYTTDGTEPNTGSLKYTGPIELPLGISNFKFTVISDEGVCSETVSRSYEFAFETNITLEAASANVTRALVKRKVLTDMEGHAQGVAGKYIFQYNSIVELNQTYYYVFNEYYEDTNGSRTRQERMYAVEVYTGDPNRLVYDERGQEGLIPLDDEKKG